MEDTIVFYTPSDHSQPTIALAKFISKHHPSISMTIISTAAFPSSAAVLPKTISYHPLPAVPMPPNLSSNPVEFLFEIPRLHNTKLREALERISETSKIKALVIDFFCNSAFEVSRSLNIPTFFEASLGASGLCEFLYHPTFHKTVPGDIADFNDFLEIPGCPPLHSADVPKGLFRRKTIAYKHFLDTANNMRMSSGILLHAFDALEYRAKEALSNGLCNPDGPTPPVYFVSPTVAETLAYRENTAALRHECLTWLDLQPDKSVIFLCFGRRGTFSMQQLHEIAVGLERSGRRFLWAIRSSGAGNGEPDLSVVLPEGFLERTKDIGLVITTWAPQKEVLSHVAVCGFVTHCGWNSVLEAVSFGVPMIGWPLYAEQRMNRVFMVEEIKVALPLEEEADGLVRATELEKRVRELTESVRGKAVSRRVEEMRLSAEKAVSKGGTSLIALEKFMDSITL
uniref:Glycosyltransferase n=1 Tax=Linaria vulgaris TaxID=43171 RepID=Q33DV2_LINVU|nr:UDP-glucose glucosyltransferase [Linaria vulgaris]